MITRGHILYTDGYKYKLEADYICYVSIFPEHNIKTEFIDLRTDGLLFIRKHFPWDGASGPTWDDDTNQRGSLVHDAIYWLLRHGYLSVAWRVPADAELKRIMLDDKCFFLRAWYYEKAVNLFAGYAASQRNVRKIHCSPKHICSEAWVPFVGQVLDKCHSV